MFWLASKNNLPLAHSYESSRSWRKASAILSRFGPAIFNGRDKQIDSIVGVRRIGVGVFTELVVIAFHEVLAASGRAGSLQDL